MITQTDITESLSNVNELTCFSKKEMKPNDPNVNYPQSHAPKIWIKKNFIAASPLNFWV
jgi:hypothetical protein